MASDANVTALKPWWNPALPKELCDDLYEVWKARTILKDFLDRYELIRHEAQHDAIIDEAMDAIIAVDRLYNKVEQVGT